MQWWLVDTNMSLYNRMRHVIVSNPLEFNNYRVCETELPLGKLSDIYIKCPCGQLTYELPTLNKNRMRFV